MRATCRRASAWLRRLRTGLRVRLLVLRARRHLAAWRWEQGVADLRAALELRPEDFSALLWLSRAYLRVGEVSRARHILARVPQAVRERHAARVLRAVAAEGHGGLEPTPQAGGLPRSWQPPAMPLGDCRDAPEHAHFQHLPPLPPAGSVDWDEVGRRLQAEAGPLEGSQG